jgi:hypothetical protein
MVWDFTPTQVMKGEVEYSFDDFYRDLTVEIKENFGSKLSGEKLNRAVNLSWIFCHLKATEPTREAVVAKLVDWEIPNDSKILDIVDELHKENAEMLMAIYQNLFLKFYKSTFLSCWGDDEKAFSEAALLVDLYIKRHVRVFLSNENSGGDTPQA